MRVGRCISHTLDDGRHAEFERVVWYRLGPVGKDEKVHLPIGEDGDNGWPIDLFLGSVRIASSQCPCILTKLKVPDFFIIKPSSGKRWRVNEEEEAGDTAKDGYDTLNDEDLCATRSAFSTERF